MATLESLTLRGCTPAPLASYLKALGVLRLISSDANNVSGQAADPRARGWWEAERFCLMTELNRDALLRFFLEEYAPSPIIAPWNGGSGFYPKDNQDGFLPLASEPVAKRFEAIARAISVASQIIVQHGLVKSPKGAEKVEFVATLRATLPDSALGWIDAALAFSGDRLSFPRLLGTGGGDGRLDFTSNFMRRLVSEKRPCGIFDSASGRPLDGAHSLLVNALFHEPTKGLNKGKIGQFAPGAAGGPNATAGYSADSNVNPWDFVIMLEGTVVFAGAVTRRHQAGSQGASFPFTVRAVGAGWGGVEAADEKDARAAEFWAPLWRRPAQFREVDALLTEGRAVLNGRTARDGLDFARAVTSLGVSRGFSEFERYGFLKRAGDAYRATPLGRRSAAKSTAARLVADLDAGGWLDRMRRIGRADAASAAARHAIKRLEDTLFDLVEPTSHRDAIQQTLVALGQVCSWLAVSPKGREAVQPLPLLSSAWIRAADDGSPEFRVAAALAGLGQPPITQRDKSAQPASIPEGMNAAADGLDAPPMAAHFAPIDEGRFFDGKRLRVRRAWSKDDSPPTVVWGVGRLVSNMIAVLERRLVEGAIRGLDDKPLAGSTYARLTDVTAFLLGGFDDRRCASLLAGMIWVRPTWLPRTTSDSVVPRRVSVPFAYAAIKPVFTPDRSLRCIGALPETARMPIPPGLVSQLSTGGTLPDGHATGVAVRAAMARARASGLPSPFDPARAGGRRVGAEDAPIGAGLRADRLAAALLIPVYDKSLESLVRRAYPGTLTEDTDQPDKDTDNAA